MIPEKVKEQYPEKFVSEHKIFSHIHRGDRIFIGTGCGEPQYLVQALVDYVSSHPKSVLDAEVFHVWTLGVAPYAHEKFEDNFRHNSFFIGKNTRDQVNEGLADYTPVALSAVPDLFRRKVVVVDVALVQTSPPDKNGYMSLGVSVDITKAAVENGSLIIAQVNSRMPRVHGEAFVHIEDVDFIIERDEPLLEYHESISDDIAQRVGKYVARIVEDGDTIQAGYGSVPNAILANLKGKRHLGVHTELLSDGMVDLIREGVADNSRKSINRGKAVASFCMGQLPTYEFIDDNPGIEFRPVDYVNHPLVIAQHRSMVAINGCLQIDLTGQATAESIGKRFYSGIGGQTDFMRGAVMSPGGKTILVILSTAQEETISRIVPFLSEGAGVTLGRSDVHYVVSEFGIAYLHGKSIRERAMELIAIAHPKFRGWLVEEARNLKLIYKDQKFIPGKEGEYPEQFETYRTTKSGLEILLRPVKMSDEPLLKDFFYNLSDQSLYRRFISLKKSMPHRELQELVILDYTQGMSIVATVQQGGREEVLGLSQYAISRQSHMAEVAFIVADEHQNRGIGTELISYITLIAKRQGLLGFTAEVLMENRAMLHVFDKMGFDMQRQGEGGIYELRMMFKDAPPGSGR